MAKLNDLTGKTFGSWKVLYRNGSTPNKAAIWRCECQLCGSQYDVVGSSLINGYSTKCRRCVPRITLKKQHRGDRIYHIYSAMKQRCYNENSLSFPNYGGRGIKMCDDWYNSPDSFIEWAYNNGYADELTLDRIDNDKGYYPENCRWVTYKEQANNKRNNIIIIYKGDTYTLREICLLLDIPYDNVRSYRRRHGIDYQDAFDHYISMTEEAI